MTILVTGANGQLGQSIREAAVNAADNYIFTDVAELDITDTRAVRRFVDINKVDVIVNCAAYTNVEKAETEPELAELLNATAVSNLAEALKQRNGVLMHISTDYVFGAEPYNTPCTERRTGTPTGVYGLTKLHGEQAIASSGVRALIFRTSWLYSPFGHNFAKTMLRLTAEKPALQVVFDQVGTPTYAADLAEAIVCIIAERKYQNHEGIYNYSNEGVCSWYDFACAIADISGHTDCRISPCHSSEYPSVVKRPAYSVLDKTLFKTTFGLDIPHWTTSLRTCLSKIARD